jgi:hypothetical protein
LVADEQGLIARLAECIEDAPGEDRVVVGKHVGRARVLPDRRSAVIRRERIVDRAYNPLASTRGATGVFRLIAGWWGKLFPAAYGDFPAQAHVFASEPVRLWVLRIAVLLMLAYYGVSAYGPV